MEGTYWFIAQKRVHFGKPAAATVMEEAELRDASRILVVASRTLSRTTDVVDAIVEAVGPRHCHTWDDTREHVPRESVISLIEAVRAHRPDLIVTIGGGTPVDTVKVALAGLAEDVRTADQLGDLHIRVGKDGALHIPAIGSPPCRQIIVPTTLSGAEFSELAGAVDAGTGVKHLYTASEIGGDAAILDPHVTLHTPEWLWLSTGVRAVDHAVESICSSAPQPYTDATCIRALQMFATSLRDNKNAPENLDARLASQMAVWLATTGLGRIPYGASHGIGHQLGAVANLAHGYCSCVMLPAVLRYNAKINAKQQEIVSEALGRPGLPAGDAVQELISDLDLPTRLRDTQVRRDQFEPIANGSLGNLMVRQNPRPINDAGEILEILEMAW